MNKSRLLVSFALILLITAFSQATTVERLNLDDMVKKAHKIVVGKVSKSRTYWSGNGKLILTTYTMEVEEAVKGPVSQTLEVTTIGGRIGDLTLHVSGMPSFVNGESAVVFVEESGTFSTVVGLDQGKFTVTNGEVSNSVSGLAFPDGRPGTPLKMPLATFKKQIKSILDR
jgi:hypothetical protein